MKRTLLAAILATAAIAFSCTVEEPAKSSFVVMNPTVTIADFTYAGPATKTTFNLNDNVASFAFAASDVLRAYSVAPEIGDGLRFTVKQSKGTSCVFQGEGFGLEAGSFYAAYYPGDSEEVPAVEEVPVDFSAQSQPSANEWNLSDVDFLYATGIEPASGACNFAMKHLGALLIMDVTFQKAGVYKSLVLRSSANFPVKGTVDLTQENVVITPTATSNKLTLALGGANGMQVAAGQAVRFYMMVPPVDMSNATLTLRLLDAQGNTVLTKDGPGMEFKAGEAVAFGATPIVNLSANGTANTYIVSAAGDYCFNATVAGNGQPALPSGIMTALGFSLCYPSPETAALAEGHYVRVPLNQNNCISDVTIADGKIYFTATGNEGNAKIQMRDANDDGVWVWTIWCTDQPAEVTIPTSDGSKNYTLLDRNIGATTAEAGNTEANCGLYYMFGDPIGYTIAEWNNGNEDGYRMVDELAHSPAFPYCNRGGDYTWFNYWQCPSNSKQVYAFFWGAYGSGAGDTWGATFTRQPGTASFKVLYDPCPAGYKVMAYDVLLGYNDTSSFANFTADETGIYIAGADDTLYIPYGGNCWKGGYTWMAPGTYCYLWTSAHNNSNMAWSYMIYKKDPDRAGGGEDHSHIIARGMPVRCMKQ
ncbi:MAG: fimbrillin family protein [Bacteroidales bacterium]|nr:fimbrillin family protein [Bacteroidales bacterium]